MDKPEDELSLLREIRDAVLKQNALIEVRDNEIMPILREDAERAKQVRAWQPFWRIVMGLIAGALWAIFVVLWAAKK